MILKTANYIYIFEFKINSNPRKAIDQIYEKGYARPFEIDSRTVFLIGVDFSTQTRTINNWIIETLSNDNGQL